MAVEAMITRPVAAFLMLLSLWTPALAGDLIGQASTIDGDTLEIRGTRIRLWGSTRLRAPSSAAAKTVCNFDAAQRPLMILTPSSHGALSAACP